jgi:hypothetical protein
MDRKSVSFVRQPLFINNSENVKPELAIERERWMLKSFHQDFPRNQKRSLEGTKTHGHHR